jgi:ribosomal protein S18 acetylase RimI-like enzyme
MLAPETATDIRVRAAASADLDALLALENAVFTTDKLTRRGFRRLLAASTAELIVVDENGVLAGYAMLFYRKGASVARLYSIAIAPVAAGKGIGLRLLDAAEAAAQRRGCTRLRLEVNEHNARAIALYRKSGYELFGRHADYYDDHGDALRFEKKLST